MDVEGDCYARLTRVGGTWYRELWYRELYAYQTNTHVTVRPQLGKLRQGRRSPMDKMYVAREQLVMALDLFLKNKSPVCVHTLAGAAREILESLCDKEGKTPFREHILSIHPDLTNKEVWKLMNKYRNPLKHHDKEDKELLEIFSDAQNDMILMIAIHDYHRMVGKWTIPMQIFRMWWGAVYVDKLMPEKAYLGELFAYLKSCPREAQKAELRKQIAKAQDVPDLMNHPETEARRRGSRRSKPRTAARDWRSWRSVGWARNRARRGKPAR